MFRKAFCSGLIALLLCHTPLLADAGDRPSASIGTSQFEHETRCLDARRHRRRIRRRSVPRAPRVRRFDQQRPEGVDERDRRRGGRRACGGAAQQKRRPHSECGRLRFERPTTGSARPADVSSEIDVVRRRPAPTSCATGQRCRGNDEPGESSRFPAGSRKLVAESHAVSDSGPSTRMIADATRRQAPCSRASSLRPVRVSV